MSHPVYLIIASDGVGGAEKRFAEIWLWLVQRASQPSPILVLPEQTYQALRKRPDLGDLARFEGAIIRYRPDGESLPSAMRALWPIVRAMPRGAIVHYPLRYFPFVHRRLGHRLVISWVGSALPPLQLQRHAFRRWLVAQLSFREANLLDVLNPNVLKKLSGSGHSNRKLRLTAGGTFVDLDHFRPSAKTDKIAFLGRLEREKGALRFARSIPAADRLLRERGIEAEFALYGAIGDEIELVRAEIASSSANVSIRYADDPQRALADATVFMSLQQISNYPSKALAEAMACGCIPVMTDTGESRLMVDDGLAEFVAVNYGIDDLAEAIVRVFALSPAERSARKDAIRSYSEKRFRIDVQGQYFAELYQELGATLQLVGSRRA